MEKLNAEIDRLRAERDELRNMLEAALADTTDYMDIVQERTRLREEKERLRDVLEALWLDAMSVAGVNERILEKARVLLEPPDDSAVQLRNVVALASTLNEANAALAARLPERMISLFLIAALPGENGEMVYSQCQFQAEDLQWIPMNAGKIARPGAFPREIVQIELTTPHGQLTQQKGYLPRVILWKDP